jgi:hypothetical protein
MLSGGVFMDLAEKIIQHVKSLPKVKQIEVLDFVEYLRAKGEKTTENEDWSAFSLSSAMHGMENEQSPYSLDDLKESFK